MAHTKSGSKKYNASSLAIGTRSTLAAAAATLWSSSASAAPTSVNHMNPGPKKCGPTGEHHFMSSHAPKTKTIGATSATESAAATALYPTCTRCPAHPAAAQSPRLRRRQRHAAATGTSFTGKRCARSCAALGNLKTQTHSCSARGVSRGGVSHEGERLRLHVDCAARVHVRPHSVRRVHRRSPAAAGGWQEALRLRPPPPRADGSDVEHDAAQADVFHVQAACAVWLCRRCTSQQRPRMLCPSWPAAF